MGHTDYVGRLCVIIPVILAQLYSKHWLIPSCATDPSSSRQKACASTHASRILLLNGLLRERSCSKLLTLEAEEIFQRFGAETEVFDPLGLPTVESVSTDHPKVQEREVSQWPEGQVWWSLERHVAMTGVVSRRSFD